MTTIDIKQNIEMNKKTISELLSGNSCRRLNSLNWLRHELSNETRILFHLSAKEQKPFLDYSNMRNLGEAWDYILENKKIEIIDELQICKIHSILCKDTHIKSGSFRTTEKYLDLYVNGQKMHAPHYSEISSRLSEITYNLVNSKCGPLIKAFNLHFDLIKLQPFEDFNKRTARMIMNWVLIQNGYRPIIFNYKSDKKEYMEALRNRAHKDCKSYSRYMYSCMLRTQNDLIRMLKNSKIL
ncbi:MAG: Fic family protein [Alphaproteobacteria bacterium]|nr:Fic family protein [Alphaproteobacteria bacterium]MBN2675034.1 Fic family protein [Alphaproteobacteria bacterium]